METTQQFHVNVIDTSCEVSLAAHLEPFTQYLIERRYSAQSLNSYQVSAEHFAHWLKRNRLTVSQIDEALVARFVKHHLPQCRCAGLVRRTHKDVRAALGHLLIVLRANGLIAERLQPNTPVDQELQRFDEYMSHVRGLAPNTRGLYLRIVHHLLRQQFAHRPVVIARIKPNAVRKFITEEGQSYSTPASAGSIASALRGYFRYRGTRGDHVHHLIGVVTFPANWQLASLPKALSNDEVDRLLGALGGAYPSARRSDAIVRCAVDLGLRSSEIAYLGLDDIDWRAGTITLKRTKSRREDVLPLPAATGQAIADYLKYERPQTSNRAVFVRHLAPRDQPVGPDLVRKAIRQAYARAGLPYTRAHLLRHTMASRLLGGGSSLKEVADVLRHRSLNTTLIYAKLDSRTLSAVALPWPGSAS